MANSNLRELEDRLNDRDKEFCRQLIITNSNSYKSALNAGFAPSTAKARASEWVRKTRETSSKPDLFDYYSLLVNDALTANGISLQNVLSEIKAVAMSDITKVVELNGGLKMRVKAMSEIPESIRPAISGITRSSYGITVRFHDKLGALKMLMDYLSVSDDKSKGSITIDKVEFNVKGSQSKLMSPDQAKSQKN